MYKLGICPRLDWPSPSTSFHFVDRARVGGNGYKISQAVGQPCKVCQPQPPIHVLPQKRQWPQPAIIVLSLQLQVSQQCQILTSADPCVQRTAENGLQSEISAEWKKFRPAVMVQQTMQDDPSQSRRALAAAAKR